MLLAMHRARTAAIAKWHLGYALINGTQRHLPDERGFDYFHGTPATHVESGGRWPPEPVFMTGAGGETELATTAGSTDAVPLLLTGGK